MSIKKLFDSTEKTRSYLADTDNKQAYKDVESSENLEQIRIKQEHFQPQIDYNNPSNFARYGSAVLYYKSAFTRILDYYPYDGSDAEINRFYNGCLDIEKYILDSLYPRTNGYIRINNTDKIPDGIAANYGFYNSVSDHEYIKFYGGPGTGSVTSTLLRDLSPNAYSDSLSEANIYDENIYQNDGKPSDYGKGTRESNLKSNFDDGVTIEFWLDQDSDIDGAAMRGTKKVIFDMWNGAPSASADYGRISLALKAQNTTSTGNRKFILTCQSGTTEWNAAATNQTASGFFEAEISDWLTPSEFQKWNHYAVTIQNSGSQLVAKFYVTGGIQKETVLATGISSGLGEINPKPTNQVDNSTWKPGLRANLGALITAPSGTADHGAIAPTLLIGAGRLSGSLDEFRFWKTARSAKEIGENYFTQIRGGVNTDISNTTLGVYYKFNEGITNTASVDSSILDYAGRVTNATWTGYTAGARSVGSAIVSSSAASKEYKDPIIRPMHPEVVSLKSSLVGKGQAHDYNNNASMLSLLPGWIVDEEEVGQPSDLQNMCHIVGAYFDKLYLQISQLPRMRQLNYTSASHKPIPFAEHLPQSLGLYSPELFVDASVMEKFTNRDQTKLFENDLHDAKNLIYSNLYNNLTSIFKSKGTEKSIKNVFRCFNIDDKLLRVTVQSNQNEFVLHDNVSQTLVSKNCVNFNQSGNVGAVVYQRSSSASGFGPSSGYLTGSSKFNLYGFTAEANIIFPYFNELNATINRDFISSSLFGVATLPPNSADFTSARQNGTDTTFANDFVTNTDYANFQVSVVKENPTSKNAYFVLESRYPGYGGNYHFPTLTSSMFLNVYDNEQWNLSVRLKPTNYPYGGHVGAGSTGYIYDVVFSGINTVSDTIAKSFTVSGTMAKNLGEMTIGASKRLWVGALRTNLTGAIINRTDVLVPTVKYYTKYLEDSTLKQHALDVDNVSVSGSQFHALSPLDPNRTETGDVNDSSFDITNSDMLALNWNFNGITASLGDGTFTVQDFSSGSYLSNFPVTASSGWLSRINQYQHAGYGNNFISKGTDAIEKRQMNTYRFINPEHVISSDLVTIFDDEDKLHPPTEFIPNYVYSIEKSIYNSVSEEMLDFFAGVVDFNNMIGAPVNRYRDRYKSMEFLRETFFRRVSKVTEVEKYLNYYKWFDDALTSIISQLIPASAEFIDDVMNVVEPHVLERPKYQTKFPTLNFINPEIKGYVEGWMASAYPPRLGRSTTPSSPRRTDEHLYFWKNRALRDSTEISSGDATIDAQREKFRKVVSSHPTLSSSFPILSNAEGVRYRAKQYSDRAFPKLFGFDAKLSEGNPVTSSTVKGGVNFPPSKNIEFARAAVWPAGPVNSEDFLYIPENVLLSLPEDHIQEPALIADEAVPTELRKKRRRYAVKHGRDYQGGYSYSNTDSTMAFPFNIFSASSAQGGYLEHVHAEVTGNIVITNLHNDVYGPMMEKPIQGPFTDYAVGGLQSRHVPLNYDARDTWHTRGESFRVLLGSCVGPPGAIGVVGPDYPWPEANNQGDRIYPITGSRKAYLYRDFIAKRPLNFKNILMRTSSAGTILGNFQQQYDVVHSFGTYQNPRHFIDHQPPLPDTTFDGNTKYATQARTYLDIRRNNEGHVQLLPDYSVAYLTGTMNQNIITTRFSNPGDVQTMGIGYRDFRGNEYSVYNGWNYRNLQYHRTSQMPSGTISEVTGTGTPGIRLFDIHGKDIGLYAHRARHASRFGRDSVATPETFPVDGTAKAYGLTGTMAPRIEVGPFEYAGPGYNYNLDDISSLQGWWRLDKDLTTSLTASDSSGRGRTGTIASGQSPTSYSSWHPPKNTNNSDPTSYIQTRANYFQANQNDKVNIGNSATWDGIIGNWTIYSTTQKMTFAAWVLKWTNGAGAATSALNSPRIFDFSNDIFAYVLASGQLVFAVKWDSNSGGKHVYWISKDSVITNANGSAANARWYHMAITYDANSVHNQPRVYIDGQRVKMLLGQGTVEAPYDGIATAYDCYIGGSDLTDNSTRFCDWNGFISDFAVWQDVLSDGAIKAMYHVGLNGLVEINSSAPGASYDQLPAKFKIHRNSKRRIRELADGSYVTSSRYDNYNVQHQIPQSDLQYKWIANAVTDPNSSNYFGYQKTYGDPFFAALRSGSTTGWVPYWNFASASDVMPIIESSGGYGYAQVGKSAFAGGYQPIARLNTITLDAVSGAQNTLGFPSGANAAEAYLNDTLNNTAYIQSASYLNLLLSRRQATYGWTWQMWRGGFSGNPILLEEYKNNKLSAVASGTTELQTFSLPPLSYKGRTSRVNFDAAYANSTQASLGTRNNITLRGAHTNEKIYFNETALDNLAAPNISKVYTPLFQAIELAAQPGILQNWLIYTQNIFPSLRNELTQRSTERIGYDNEFWRNSNVDRVALGGGTKNSFGVPVSQSAWCLDAPLGFLTRSGPANIRYGQDPPGTQGTVQFQSRWLEKAGELQNTYTMYAQGDAFMNTNLAGQQSIRYPSQIPSALYSRKHMLSAPTSIVSPSGIDIPQTGAIPNLNVIAGHGAKFGVVQFRGTKINPYAGEALWEAPGQAGIIIKSGSESKFIVSASNPWFNDYSSSLKDYKLIARGYSTVPEFRISDHIDDYIKYGSINIGVSDTFTIPGTEINSSQPSFYKDYSNSDFLQDFLNIKNRSGLEATELKLTCNAAIRFNPYKGFYPAQRTLDLVSQFSQSYGPGLLAPGYSGSNVEVYTGSAAAFGNTRVGYALGGHGGFFRPIMAPLFAPGILYNSIKSGIAVDYPVLTNQSKFQRYPFGGKLDGGEYKANGPAINGLSPDNWVLSYDEDQLFTGSVAQSVYSGAFWDKRIPFEAIIDPASHIRNVNFLDMEPHPSCSLNVTASWNGQGDQIYAKMASNFFGAVGDFFLKDRDFTNLESTVVPGDLRFPSGSVYAARVTLKRSMDGPRTYNFDSGSCGRFGNASQYVNGFTTLGAKPFVADNPATNFALGSYYDGSYPLPQDPKRNPNYRENFTMYSRPSAFGPPCTGRRFANPPFGAGGFVNTVSSSVGMSGTMDCFDGYNWGFTPPYYHGEAWADMIFRPNPDTVYDLERIMAETKTVYWRCDPGAPSGSDNVNWMTPLIPGGFTNNVQNNDQPDAHLASKGPLPYGGEQINKNAMQLSSSFNLFGVRRIFEQSSNNNTTTTTNKTIGQKWIIQPKWETPMLNFGNTGVHPITTGSGYLSIPDYGSGSVPRGMWHQFGIPPQTPNQGIFLSIEDIPKDWLQWHWCMINSASIYNDYKVPTDEKERFSLGEKYQSLTKLFGFDKRASKVRLGEIANGKTIREAVVAIPYVLENTPPNEDISITSTLNYSRKKFISIPKKAWTDAIVSRQAGAGQTLANNSAGKSISDLITKMERYVLPPQFDCINNPDVDPIAMYIFEFSYFLDKHDLSYIWQNLAPRDYQKLEFQKSAVAHELMDSQLLSQKNFIENPNLRWMVFKVKQKSQVEYWDLITDQVGEATRQLDTNPNITGPYGGYKISYNWPYDFVSFVEGIKIDVDVMYKNVQTKYVNQTANSNKEKKKLERDFRAQQQVQGKPKK